MKNARVTLVQLVQLATIRVHLARVAHSCTAEMTSFKRRNYSLCFGGGLRNTSLL